MRCEMSVKYIFTLLKLSHTVETLVTTSTNSNIISNTTE